MIKVIIWKMHNQVENTALKDILQEQRSLDKKKITISVKKKNWNVQKIFICFITFYCNINYNI